MTEFSLRRPIVTEAGEKIDTLTLDWDALSFSDLASAGKIKGLLGSQVSSGDVVISPKLDNNLRIAVAWIAAVRGTKGLALNDCLKLSLADALSLSDECVDSYLLA